MSALWRRSFLLGLLTSSTTLCWFHNRKNSSHLTGTGAGAHCQTLSIIQQNHMKRKQHETLRQIGRLIRRYKNIRSLTEYIPETLRFSFCTSNYLTLLKKTPRQLSGIRNHQPSPPSAYRLSDFRFKAN